MDNRQEAKKDLAAAVLTIALAIGSVGSATLAGWLHSPRNPDLLLIEYLEKQQTQQPDYCEKSRYTR
jgi:hypothetical protein